MKKSEFKSLLKKKILTLDGAIGTYLHSSGLSLTLPPEAAVFEMPDVLRRIHEMYIEAGADIILTNTFGATPARLKEYNLAGRMAEINRSAVLIARKASNAGAFVGVSIGPSGYFVKPLGELTFDEAFLNFKAQADALKEEPPDLIIFETFSDLMEIKAAVIAVMESLSSLDIPIIAQMTFQEDGRSVTGTDPETFAVVMEALGIDGIGANCSIGPAELVSVIGELAKSTHLPICVEPNAGLPRLSAGKTVFDMTPAQFANFTDDFINAGASIIGSCCGTTPDFTRMIAEKVKGKKQKEREPHDYLRLSSRTKTVSFKPGEPIRPVGERINPSGRKQFKEELKSGNMSTVRQEALRQEEAGAAAVDVNVSVFKSDQQNLMESALDTVQSSCNLPILIDNSDPEIVETALKKIAGKPMINSITGEKDKLEKLIPIARKYGAAIIGLALGEEGIPETADSRIQIATKIIDHALKNGISARDIAIDLIVLSVSTGAEKAKITLEALKKFKEELKMTTILGVSNISFGLPNRSAVNSTFLTMALERGLDIPIVDPIDPLIKNVIASHNLLEGSDPGGKEYISMMADIPEQDRSAGIKAKEAQNLSPLELIKKAVVEGDKSNIQNNVSSLLDFGIEPLAIVNEAFIPAMDEVGRLFDSKKYFLPQVILAAETMQAGFELLKKDIDTTAGANRSKTIIFATVKGDVHDLGKNIVITLLQSNGHRVIDLGKSVPAEDIISAAEKNKADVIALSALMTTTMGEMEVVTRMLADKKLNIAVIVGGAVVNRSYADEINAIYGKNAIDAVKIISNIFVSSGVPPETKGST